MAVGTSLCRELCSAIFPLSFSLLRANTVSHSQTRRVHKPDTMQLSKALELLVVGLSAISVAEATFANVNRMGGDVKALEQRQTNNNDEADSSETTTSTTAEPETTSTPAARTTTSSTTSSTSATPTEDERTSSSSRTAGGGVTTTTTSAGETIPTETPPPETTEGSPTTTSASETLEPTVITEIVTSTYTNADGSLTTVTSSLLTTQTPGLADGGSSNQSSGMSPQTRNTVIGVVVGVGGAIILGGLALVAWRIWGRKKPQEENDGLMDYGSTVDKPETVGSMGGRSPFQSTLESYHAPTHVNTAANF